MGAHSAPRKRNSRYMTLAAVAVLALAAWWLFFGRSDGHPGSANSSGPRTTAQADAGSSGSTELKKRSATGTVETFEVFASRDPFAPLVEDDDKAGGSGPDAEGNLVKLVDAASDGGTQVVVNGTVYTVAEGETFAENYKLLSVSGDCASLLYGDDQFTMCEGEEILK